MKVGSERRTGHSDRSYLFAFLDLLPPGDADVRQVGITGDPAVPMVQGNHIALSLAGVFHLGNSTGGSGEHVGSLRHQEVQAVVLDRNLVERIDLHPDGGSYLGVGQALDRDSEGRAHEVLGKDRLGEALERSLDLGSGSHQP